MHDYEVSAVYMEGVVSTIRDAGVLDAVRADVSPQSQAVLTGTRPGSSRTSARRW